MKQKKHELTIRVKVKVSFWSLFKLNILVGILTEAGMDRKARAKIVGDYLASKGERK